MRKVVKATDSGFLFFFIVFFLLVVVVCRIFFGENDKFKEVRQDELERNFGLDLNGCEFISYKTGGQANTLCFSGVDDYCYFMENNLTGDECKIYLLENGIKFYVVKLSEKINRYNYAFKLDDHTKFCTISFYEKESGGYWAEVCRTLG